MFERFLRLAAPCLRFAAPCLRLAALSGGGWLWAAALGCAEPTADDADRLSSLSTGQLRALCGELADGWAGERELLECDNGTTLFLDREGIAACGSQTTECSATAGEWRACMRALFDDSCQGAAAQEPAECTVLLSAEGCSGLALPLQSQCTAPSADYAAAFDGVYDVVSHTRNNSGCDVEGTPISPAGYLALAAMRFPGRLGSPLQNTPMVGLQYCGGIEACRQTLAEIFSASDPYSALYYGQINADLPESFVCGPDSSGALLASSLSTSGGPACSRTSLKTSLRLEPDGSVRIELQTFELPPPAEGDPCYFTVYPEPEGRCVSFEVLLAQRVAQL